MEYLEVFFCLKQEELNKDFPKDVRRHLPCWKRNRSFLNS